MESQDLIYLVSCAVNGLTPDAEHVAAMDLDAIYKLASRHLLAAAVAPALKAAGVQDQRFAKALEHSVLKSSTMDMEADALYAELDAAGIWHMPLKGAVLQHLYPVYGMRQMSDRDILFDADRAEDVKATMEGLGFTMEDCTGRSIHDHYLKPPVCNFELHRTLFGAGNDPRLVEYFRDVKSRLILNEGSSCGYHFRDEDFYIYILAHEYKHYAWGGTGLRSVLDTYVFLKRKSKELNWAYISGETEKLGLADFEEQNRALAQHLFSGEELTEADREMLDYILSSGVYGTMAHRVENKMRKNGWGKLRYAAARLYVPLSEKNEKYAALTSFYSFFYKHKVLLPFLPFYRLLRGLKNGRMIAELKALKNVKSSSSQ